MSKSIRSHSHEIYRSAEKFYIIYKKNAYNWVLFKQNWRPSLKKNTIGSVFQYILLNFSEQPFHGTPLSECFHTSWKPPALFSVKQQALTPLQVFFHEFGIFSGQLFHSMLLDDCCYIYLRSDNKLAIEVLPSLTVFDQKL